MNTSNTTNTNTAKSKKPSTVGSQNPSASNVSADEWKAFRNTGAITAAGTRYSARAGEDDDDDDDDSMTPEQVEAARRSAQKRNKRPPSGPSVSK
jgi:hypothetical protein